MALKFRDRHGGPGMAAARAARVNGEFIYMLPAKFMWKPLVHKIVTGHWSRFRMLPTEPPFPSGLKRTGLYLHVPFCKNLCPFCPYNRMEYDEALFGRYEKAVIAEIELYAPYLEGCEFVSLYVGGGTPTVNPAGLMRIIDHLRGRLDLSCDICIELHPSSMDTGCLGLLKDAGVTMISIGVESTSDRLLNTIGRSHDGATAVDAVGRAAAAGFKAVNVDLMFALPGQSVDEWEEDLKAVFKEGIDQLSTYPMFNFPYSELGKTQGLREIKRPDSKMIRSMLKLTDEYASMHGFKRCAVWSWLKPSKGKFSSITRHHYIGFGPSAASMTGSQFYVNTFDVNSYVGTLPHKRPVALSMPVDRRLEMAYWLYWRVYELKVMEQDFRDVFGRSESLEAVFSHVLKPFSAIGMMEKGGDGYHVTPSGAYWIHRLQNEYSLNYINRLWGKCRIDPWPPEVAL